MAKEANQWSIDAIINLTTIVYEYLMITESSMTNETYVDATLSKSKLFNFVAIFEVLHTYLEPFYIAFIGSREYQK